MDTDKTLAADLPICEFCERTYRGEGCMCIKGVKKWAKETNFVENLFADVDKEREDINGVI